MGVPGIGVVGPKSKRNFFKKEDFVVVIMIILMIYVIIKYNKITISF